MTCQTSQITNEDTCSMQAEEMECFNDFDGMTKNRQLPLTSQEKLRWNYNMQAVLSKCYGCWIGQEKSIDWLIRLELKFLAMSRDSSKQTTAWSVTIDKAFAQWPIHCHPSFFVQMQIRAPNNAICVRVIQRSIGFVVFSLFIHDEVVIIHTKDMNILHVR